jgi:DNA-binding CsgD family transcriptional regulator
MRCAIYKVRNKVNDKVYIGKTKMNPPEKRYKLHLRISRNIPCYKKRKQVNPVHYALAKYGEGRFEFSVIESTRSEKKAYEREMYWVAYYKSQDKSKGYNLTPGGDGVRQTKELQKKKRKAAIAARDRGGYRVSITKEQAVEIKRLIAQGNMTNRAIAKRFDIRPQTVGRIQKNQIFKDVLKNTPVLIHGQNGFYQPGYQGRQGNENHAAKLTAQDAQKMIKLRSNAAGSWYTK